MITTATKAFEIVNRIFEANYPELSIISISIPEPSAATWNVQLTLRRNGVSFGALVELDAISEMVNAIDMVPSVELRISDDQLLTAMEIDRFGEVFRDAGLSEKELDDKRQLLATWVQGKLEAKGLKVTPDALSGLCNLIVALMEAVARSLSE